MKRFYIKVKDLFKRVGFVKISENIFWQFGDKFFRMGVGFFIGVWIARFLGPEKFGTISFAQSFVVLFSALSSFGIDSVLVRDLVKTPEKKYELIGSAFMLKVVGGFLVLITSYLAILFLHSSDELLKLLVVVNSLIYLFQSFNVIDLWFQSIVKSKFTVISQAVVMIIMSAIKVYLIVNKFDILAFVIVLSLENIFGYLSLIVPYVLSKEKLHLWSPKLDSIFALLKESWPLMLSSISVMLYMRLDQILIGQMLGPLKLGIYSVAVRIAEISYFVPVIFVNSVYPVIVKTKIVNQLLYMKRQQSMFSLMTLFSLIIIIPIVIFSKEIIIHLYGYQYIESARVLSVYILTLLFVFWGVAQGPWMMTEGLMKFSLVQTVTGLIINLILNILLIPVLGILGSAIATLISQMFSNYFINYFYKPNKELFIIQTKSIYFSGIKNIVD